MEWQVDPANDDHYFQKSKKMRISFDTVFITPTSPAAIMVCKALFDKDTQCYSIKDHIRCLKDLNLNGCLMMDVMSRIEAYWTALGFSLHVNMHAVWDFSMDGDMYQGHEYLYHLE